MNALVVRKQSETAIQSDAESRPSSPTAPKRTLAALVSKLGAKRKRDTGEDNTRKDGSRSPVPDPGDDRHDVHDVSEDSDDSSTHESCFRRYWKYIISIGSSQLGLLVLLVVYSFIGGAIFQAIEGPHEEDQKADLEREKRQLLQLIWSAIQNETDHDNFTRLFDEQLHSYDKASKKAFEHGITAGDDEKIWDYWGALFFSTTIFTTVGTHLHVHNIMHVHVRSFS